MGGAAGQDPLVSLARGCLSFWGELVQLVERLLCKQEVKGSTPLLSTKSKESNRPLLQLAQISGLLGRCWRSKTLRARPLLTRKTPAAREISLDGGSGRAFQNSLRVERSSQTRQNPPAAHHCVAEGFRFWAENRLFVKCGVAPYAS